MNRAQLRQVRKTIGDYMGWLTRGRSSYTVERFAHDLETIHPQLLSGRPSILQNVLWGKVRPKPWWDKPVMELLERAVTGRSRPPTPGPLWFTDRHSQMRGPQGLAAISVHLSAWREDRGLTRQQLAERSGISEYRLNRMEARATREALTSTEIEHLAEALGVKPWALTDSPARSE